jgi:hypothetical protein
MVIYASYSKKSSAINVFATLIFTMANIVEFTQSTSKNNPIEHENRSNKNSF